MLRKGWTWTNLCSERITPYTKRKRRTWQGRTPQTAPEPSRSRSASQNAEWIPHILVTVRRALRLCDVPAQVPKPNLTVRKQQTNPNGGSFHGIPDQLSLKLSWKTRKEHEMVTAQRRVGDMMTKCNTGSWIGSWDTGSSFVEKPGTSKYSL